MKIMAIDPGLRHCGVAVIEDGLITYGALIKNPERTVRGPKAWRAMGQEVAASYPLDVDLLVLEVPQVYRGAYSKGDPADLIELAGVDGALCALILADEVEGYLPKQWKGSVPKEVHHARIQKRLTNEEARFVDWPTVSLCHNVWDAIAMAYWSWDRKSVILKSEAV